MTISEKEALVLTIMGASGASVDRPMTAYNVYRGAAGFDDRLNKNQVVRLLEEHPEFFFIDSEDERETRFYLTDEGEEMLTFIKNVLMSGLTMASAFARAPIGWLEK